MEPLCVDLFCGLGGWAEGFLAEGYRVVGFDIERHDYGSGGYPGQLVLQDALTLRGSQFRDAACIVASPPCQEFSYMAMPWKLAKAKAAAIRADQSGEAMRKLTALFNACFRIQREASEAATMTYGCASCGVYHPATVLDGCIFTPRYIPMVVENVKGAQPWVGPAKAHFGSFYLWGDVAMVGNRVVSSVPVFGRWTRPVKTAKLSGRSLNQGAGKWRPANGLGFELSDGAEQFDEGRKNDGGSWFNIGSPGQTETGRNPVHELAAQKVPGFNFHEHEKTGKPGRSFQSAAVESTGMKGKGSWFGDYQAQKAATLEGGVKCGGDWFNDKQPSISRMCSSKSPARKAASAEIAKIPFELASYIARSYNTSTVN